MQPSRIIKRFLEAYFGYDEKSSLATNIVFALVSLIVIGAVEILVSMIVTAFICVIFMETEINFLVRISEYGVVMSKGGAIFLYILTLANLKNLRQHPEKLKEMVSIAFSVIRCAGIAILPALAFSAVLGATIVIVAKLVFNSSVNPPFSFCVFWWILFTPIVFVYKSRLSEIFTKIKNKNQENIEIKNDEKKKDYYDGEEIFHD